MKRGWTKQDLLDDRDLLIKMCEDNDNLESRLHANKVLNCINHYLESKYSPIASSKPTIKTLIENATLSYYFYGRYHSLISEFYFNTKHFHGPMIAISDRLEKILGNQDNFDTLVQCKVSDNEAINLAASFYNSFDSELAAVVSNIFKSDKLSINFVEHEKGLNKDIEADGYCIFIDLLKKYYMSVDKSENVSKISNIIHETGHILDYYYNPSKTYSEETYLLSEVPSLFPEIVSLFDNIGNRNDITTNHELYSHLTTYYEHSNALVFHEIIINKWKECGYKTNIKFYFSLRRDYGLNYSDIYRFLSHEIVNSGSYVLSFEACCELVYIYYVEGNKEKALDIYKRIIKADKNEDELVVVLKELELGKHLKCIVRKILIRFIKSIKEFERDEKMEHKLY